MAPKFIEKKLEKEYGGNKHAIFGTLNKIGAMRGSHETAKGKEMEKKHERKVRNGQVRKETSHARALRKKHEHETIYEQ